jgi:beta-glucanase (GH16 family)
MKKLILLSIISIIHSGCSNDNEPSIDDTNAPEGFTLEWSDEFDGEEINSSNWTHEVGDGTAYGLGPGWGNDEKQLYTNVPANSKIEVDDEGNSALVIIAEEEATGNYTSAKITTQNLQSFRFGKIEAKIKLPEGKGLWPAFWMLGDNITDIDWPGCGEVDILELIGDKPNTLYNNLHYTTSENRHSEELGTYILNSGKFSEQYHVFTIDWTPESITYFVDDEQTHQILIESDMKEFLRSFYLILNIAVGGNWPGDPDATTSFPQKMYVDYIRVYSKNDLEAPAAPALNKEEEAIGNFLAADPAINSSFAAFGPLIVNSWGGGGEPDLGTSTTAVDGDNSILLTFPGGNWGGGFFEMDSPGDLSSFASGNLIFSIHKPTDLVDAEIKLESIATNAAVFLKDYTPQEIQNGFLEYTIPLSDFQGLDLTELRIPFAFWNPKNGNDSFLSAEVLVDNVYFN